MHLQSFQVNFIDTYHRSGLYPRSSFPAGLGEEGAGTVVEVGPGEKPAAQALLHHIQHTAAAHIMYSHQDAASA
jgi:hypothetical protein